jgi:2,4-dienoyl-CoA reductase-like NADH-dependent reductase (Old Yellow Enzyme family)/thioredoxin reductase
MEKFNHLFSVLNIRGNIYRNRIVTGPTLFASAAFIPEISENVYRMVENRAKGGAAAVMVGEIGINFEECGSPFTKPFDYNVTKGPVFDALARYATVIKKHGSIALMEICHEGSECEVPQPYGPIDCVNSRGKTVKAMDENTMRKICDDFTRVAVFYKAAGYDGICLHGAHGFLIQQFVSPAMNKRTDDYGGSIQNRARFPLMILDALRKGLGEDGILELRISAEDGFPGGMTINDTVEFSKLADGKADIIHISNGLKNKANRTHTFTSMYDEHGFNVKFAAMVKKAVKISKVAVIGGLNSPEFCNDIIAAGKTDLVVLSRQAFADPDFSNKASSGKEQYIRRCVRCFSCYPGPREHESENMPFSMPPMPAGITSLLDLVLRQQAPKTLEEMLKRIDNNEMMSPASMGQCAINPAVSNKVYPELFPVPQSSKRVLVIGGGVAGMQAAITAAERGHKVTLVEKNSKLGGVMRFTEFDADKKDYFNFINVLRLELEANGVDTILNCEADKNLIHRIAPDYVLIAIGSVSKKSDIEGVENAIDVLETYFAPHKVGNNVVMVGSGWSGCETAIHLAGIGKKVTLIARRDNLAPEVSGMSRTSMLDEMDRRGVKSLTGLQTRRISKDGVVAVDKKGNELFIKADTVVAALGRIPDAEKTNILKAACEGIPCKVIGDCDRAGKVKDAVKSGYIAANLIA